MTQKVFYWLPRTLTILLIIFISVFALDALGTPQWYLGLLIHLIPTYVLLALTIIAWKNELIGGTLFIVAGIFSIFFFHFEALIIISIPTIAIGILFLISKKLIKYR